MLIAKEKGDDSPSEIWRVSVADGSAGRVDLNADWVPFLAVTGRQSEPVSIPTDTRSHSSGGRSPQPEIWALENFLPTLGAKK